MFYSSSFLLFHSYWIPAFQLDKKCYSVVLKLFFHFTHILYEFFSNSYFIHDFNIQKTFFFFILFNCSFDLFLIFLHIQRKKRRATTQLNWYWRIVSILHQRALDRNNLDKQFIFKKVPATLAILEFFLSRQRC